jgi:acyl-CoA thioesterase I
MIERRLRTACTIMALAMLAALPDQTHAKNRIECAPAGDMVRLSKPLPRLSARLAENKQIKILALGSSSTAGVGASRMELNYPNSLKRELHALLPNASIEVLNHGISGEDARQMLPRLDRDLATEKPDLVLWQVGTNALLGENTVESQAPLIRDGLRRIRDAGADVILMDPQYAPHVLRDPDAWPMVALLEQIAGETGVPVFRRFALMRDWHEKHDIAFSEFLAADLFHMNDWSYGCLARNLAAALVANAQTVTAAKPAATSDGTIAASTDPNSTVTVTPVSAAR